MTGDLAAIHDALRRRAWPEAHAACQAALAERPDDPALHYALGLAWCGAGTPAAAVVPLERAAALDAANPLRGRTLGVVYAQLGRQADVARVLAPILADVDADAQALYLHALVDGEAAASALAAFEALPTPASMPAELRYAVGRALHAAGRLDEAEAAFLACLDGTPPLARAHDALATLYEITDRGDRALAHVEAYARLEPTSGFAQLRLAVLLSLRGRLAEARAARLEARRLGIDGARGWTTALKHMLCDTEEDGASFVRACADAMAAIAPLPPRRLSPRRARAGRIRVGYLSGEVGVPPASHFLDPVLAAHDRSRVEVFLYETRRSPSARDLEALASLGDHTRAVGRLSDDALLALVDADGIDVLVELGSHFPFNRLGLLARRAAPVQASLPNCPATTGCREVDYLLTDQWTSPPGTERDYVEVLHRLQAGYLVYAAPRVCPPLTASPAGRNGFVTFGLIQQLMKIGADVWDAVAAVLTATPRSRLLLHNPDGELARPESATCAFLRRQLEARGVDPARMRIVGERPHVEHLGLLGEIDIALDTWPFTGTTTTCECLWMGVPVVTRTGGTHASRVSAGLLRRAGLAELVARDPAGYVGIATALAANLPALRAYRVSLRPRVIAGGLTDARALAAELETTYADWVAACSARPAAHRLRGGSAGR